MRIGRAISLGLAHAGCDLLVHYARSRAQAVEVRDAARALGVKAETYGADLADSGSGPETDQDAFGCIVWQLLEDFLFTGMCLGGFGGNWPGGIRGASCRGGGLQTCLVR